MVADLDDDLADEFLLVDDALRVRPESLKAALRRVVLGRKALPVMIGSALKNTGVQVLKDVTQYICGYEGCGLKFCDEESTVLLVIQ